MKTLIERLEKATGPSRELDAAIFKIAQPESERFKTSPFGEGPGHMSWISANKGTIHPLYTASIDAALTLVPENADWSLEKDGAWVRWMGKDDAQEVQSVLVGRDGKCTAIALCIAALKARQATTGLAPNMWRRDGSG